MYPITSGSSPSNSGGSSPSSTSRGTVTDGQAAESKLSSDVTLPDGSGTHGRVPMQASSSDLGATLLSQGQDSMDVDEGEGCSSDVSKPCGTAVQASELKLLRGEQITTYYLTPTMARLGRRIVLDSFSTGQHVDVPKSTSEFVNRWALLYPKLPTGRNTPLKLIEDAAGKAIGIFLDQETVIISPSRQALDMESGPLKRKVPHTGDGPPLAKRPRYF